MRAFYYLLLFIGLYLLAFVQLVTFALPRDAFVASVLSKSPADWDLALADSLKDRFAHENVKAELTAALQKRASFRTDLYRQSALEGGTLIVLSLLGLLREAKINRMRHQIERATPPIDPPTIASSHA